MLVKEVPEVYTDKNLDHVDGLVQERCNSIANALELRLPCTNPSMLFFAERQLDGHISYTNGLSQMKYTRWLVLMAYGIAISIRKLLPFMEMA